MKVDKEKIETIKNTIGDRNYKLNEPLSRHTTMKVGGKAAIFWVVKERENLIKIIKKCLEIDLAYLVIGRGSNIIVSDQGFPGLVVVNETSNIISQSNEAVVDSGITISSLIRKLAEKGVGGLEFLAGIPGTLGGAIFNNAGAYGKYMEGIVSGVVLLDTDGRIKQIPAQKLEFGYRTSIFKRQISKLGRQPVILGTRLKVHPASKEGVLRIVSNYEKIRKMKHPKYPSAGSFFKNILIKNESNLGKEVRLAAIEGKVPAAFLIERAGCKGLRVGGAMVAKEHANFIVNRGRAKASDIKRLAQEVKEKVKEKFGLELEEEVQYIGEIDTSKKGLFSRILKA